jgi:hypothetical protein
MVGDNGWEVHKNDVLHTLQRIEHKVDELTADTVGLRERVRAVEVRAVGLATVVAFVVSVIVREVLR